MESDLVETEDLSDDITEEVSIPVELPSRAQIINAVDSVTTQTLPDPVLSKLIDESAKS